MRTFERRGRYYDEYEVGDLFRHRPGRTITEADNTLFTTLTMNTQSLHLDAEVAAQSEFGQRLVNSLMTLAIVAGLSVGDTTEGTTIANLGFGEIAFPGRSSSATRCTPRPKSSPSGPLRRGHGRES